MYFHILTYLVMEDGIDQTLSGGPCVLQSEWHYSVMVGTSVGDEGCMFPIGRVHENLVVAGESIHEAEHLMTGRGINQQIYAGQRIAVFGASSVQVRVIDTKSPFAIVLADEDHV